MAALEARVDDLERLLQDAQDELSRRPPELTADRLQSALEKVFKDHNLADGDGKHALDDTIATAVCDELRQSQN